MDNSAFYRQNIHRLFLLFSNNFNTKLSQLVQHCAINGEI